jgi:hypothetical protein
VEQVFVVVLKRWFSFGYRTLMCALSWDIAGKHQRKQEVFAREKQLNECEKYILFTIFIIWFTGIGVCVVYTFLKPTCFCCRTLACAPCEDIFTLA